MLSFLLFAMNKFERDTLFEILYRKYSLQMFKFAFSFLHKRDEAENIVQDVFTNLIIKEEPLEKMSGMTDEEQRKYIASSIRNACNDKFRKDKRKKEHEVEESLDEIRMPNQYDNYKFIEADSSYLTRAFKKLHPKYQKAIMLKYGLGFKYDEIAEIMGISADNVGTTLSRARDKIKKDIVEMKENDKEK